MRKCKPADLEFRASKTGHSVNTLKPWMEFELCGRWSLETSMFCCCNIHPLTHSFTHSLTHSLSLPPFPPACSHSRRKDSLSFKHCIRAPPTGHGDSAAAVTLTESVEVLTGSSAWDRIQVTWKDFKRALNYFLRTSTSQKRHNTHAHTVNLR